MKVSNLVVSRAAAPRASGAGLLAGGAAAAPPAAQAQGAFITPQSFVTFPVASMLVSLAWTVLRQLFPWGSSTVVAAVIALAVGAVIFLVTVSDQDARPRTTAGWVVAVVVGFFNSLLLLAAALGISPK